MDREGEVVDSHQAGGTTDEEDVQENPELLADQVDQIQQQLGGYGRYQLIIYFLLSLIYMRGGWHVWVPIYQLWDPGYHCKATPGLTLNESVPYTIEDGEAVYSDCSQYVNKSISNETEYCHNGWSYYPDDGYTSVVSTLNMACDDEYQIELTTTMYMVGATCGVVFLAPLSDRFGSKMVMLVCLWVQAVLGTVLIWATHIAAFCIVKWGIGMCNMTIALCAYVLMTEVFDASHREIPTIAMQFFWAIGIMSTALFGFLIKKWEDLELAVALPLNILSVAFYFIIPESLPWLLSKGKIRQAKSVIEKFQTINGLDPVEDLDKQLSVFDKTVKRKQSEDIQFAGQSSERLTTDETPAYTVLTLFKTPRLRRYSIIMFYLFLVNSLAYFGIMYSTPELDGNRFINLFLLGLVEVPAYILCMIFNRYIGRRRSISIFLFICAITNIVVIFVPEKADDGTNLHQLRTALVIIGKFGITGSYSAIYLYASEVYPTVVRSTGIGASSFFENIGSIAAPNMVYTGSALENLPLAIFGSMTIVGCFVVLLLPETHNKPLPQTIEDVENGPSTGSDKWFSFRIFRRRQHNDIL